MTAMPEFGVGQRVRIKKVAVEGTNRRVPEYARGRTGTIVSVHGSVSGHRHDHADDWGPLYTVLLEPGAAGSTGERLFLDVHGPWMEDACS
jgi:hypothetical protein